MKLYEITFTTCCSETGEGIKPSRTWQIPSNCEYSAVARIGSLCGNEDIIVNILNVERVL
ncbi:hypothetical protein NVP1063O_092 [Vibrio phage 1.063.O._10N.261.45.C7]|nr:hypothetical protein NVP1063O_092 [Vibrio phage 1.063.O._10N.261.45.C7]